MAKIFKAGERCFEANPNKIDKFRLMTDMARQNAGVEPENLNFDVRRLNPGQYNAAYHFHRYAEELFMIMSGKAVLRTPEGLQQVVEGDIIFFEKGKKGAHQMYNDSDSPCIYLDIRTFIGHDICEYPDSDKLIVVPGAETFRRSEQYAYFDGEEDPDSVWKQL